MSDGRQGVQTTSRVSRSRKKELTKTLKTQQSVSRKRNASGFGELVLAELCAFNSALDYSVRATAFILYQKIRSYF